MRSNSDNTTATFYTTFSHKLVVVGDSTVGKTSMLNTLKKINFRHSSLNYTTVIGGFAYPVTVDGTSYDPSLWDTFGSFDADKLRELSFPPIDLFLVTFALNNRSSFKNVEKWIRELRSRYPNVPFLLVGTKCDLRRGAQAPDLITQKEARALQTQIRALDYVECTAENFHSIEGVVVNAIRSLLTHMESMKENEAEPHVACHSCSIV